MTLDLCIVGAGECYEKYFLPADRLLREHGIAAIRTVIDVKDSAGVRLPAGAEAHEIARLLAPAS